jgi:hypothetical protein
MRAGRKVAVWWRGVVLVLGEAATLKDPLGIYFLGSSRTLGVVSRLA